MLIEIKLVSPITLLLGVHPAVGVLGDLESQGQRGELRAGCTRGQSLTRCGIWNKLLNLLGFLKYKRWC